MTRYRPIGSTTGITGLGSLGLTAGIVASWPFDDTSGTVVRDELNTRPGTYVGTWQLNQTTIISGGTASAWADGNTAFVRIPHDAGLLLSSGTLSFVVQPRSLPPASTNRALYCKDYSFNNTDFCRSTLAQYNDGGTGRPQGYHGGLVEDPVQWFDSATGVSGQTIVVDTANRWTITWGPGGSLLYKDSTAIAAEPESLGWQLNTLDLVFAAFQNSIGNGIALFDGGIQGAQLWDRELSAGEVSDLPAASSITPPTGPGITPTAVDDAFGILASGAQDVELDVLANDANLTNRTITIQGQPGAGTLTIINNTSANAALEYDAPTPNEQTIYTGMYSVDGSNTADVQLTVAGASTGYTPGSFVEGWSGDTDDGSADNRATYDDTDPESTSFVDPTSGLTNIRITGQRGDSIRTWNSGTPTSTGLVWAAYMRFENLGSIQKNWNSNSTLLLIDRHYSDGTDTGSTAESVLIDVVGTYTGQPWQVLRAATSGALGEGGSNYFWDPLNPLRIYYKTSSGQFYEWFPIGESGENPNGPGTINFLFQYSGSPSLGSFTGANRGGLQTSANGRWHVSPATSGGNEGGILVNLIAGTFGNWIQAPTALGSRPDLHYTAPNAADDLVLARHNGTPNSNIYEYHDMTNGTTHADSIEGVHPHGDCTHNDMAIVNGVASTIGCQGNTHYTNLIDLVNFNSRTLLRNPQGNPCHVSTRNVHDTWENWPGGPSGASHQRYAWFAKNSSLSGAPAGALAVRMAPGDEDANGGDGTARFIMKDRNVRSGANRRELHPQPDMIGRYFGYASNWNATDPGGTFTQANYVVDLTNAWGSPNNDGS